MIPFWCLMPKGEKLRPKQMDQLPLENFENSRVRTFDLSKYSYCQNLVLLGVCFVAEDPKGRKHLRQILSEAAPKLSPIKLRHNDRSQDEGVNRLKDEMT
jgi:hypothetical protein